MADTYSVIVVELDDVCPRNESGLPNLLTLVTLSSPASRFARLVGEKPSPRWTSGHVVSLRGDLGLTKTYDTSAKAKKAERRLIDRLLRQGFVVNRRTPHRRVYVVELDPTAVKDPGRGFVYVGETGKLPEQRLEVHLTGASKYSRWVRKYGLRLRPDLAPSEFFLSVKESELAEAACRLRLEAEGYEVRGAHLADELR